MKNNHSGERAPVAVSGLLMPKKHHQESLDELATPIVIEDDHDAGQSSRTNAGGAMNATDSRPSDQASPNQGLAQMTTEPEAK